MIWEYVCWLPECPAGRLVVSWGTVSTSMLIERSTPSLSADGVFVRVAETIGREWPFVSQKALLQVRVIQNFRGLSSSLTLHHEHIT